MEAQSIHGLTAYITEDFERAINAIASSPGRLVISGVGKSAVIAQKIVATLNSTGTPSIFMHAADALHGDLGIVQQEDVVMIIRSAMYISSLLLDSANFHLFNLTFSPLSSHFSSSNSAPH